MQQTRSEHCNRSGTPDCILDTVSQEIFDLKICRSSVGSWETSMSCNLRQPSSDPPHTTIRISVIACAADADVSANGDVTAGSAAPTLNGAASAVSAAFGIVVSEQ